MCSGIAAKEKGLLCAFRCVFVLIVCFVFYIYLSVNRFASRRVDWSQGTVQQVSSGIEEILPYMRQLAVLQTSSTYTHCQWRELYLSPLLANVCKY